MKYFLLLSISLLAFHFHVFSQRSAVFVVNSTADDAKSHPWDNPNTISIDESTDGVCGDESQRCTLRAALEEASAVGIGAIVSFSVNGTIQKDLAQSAFGVPEHSKINGADQKVTIRGNGNDFLMGTADDVVIKGLVFANAYDGLDVGSNNTIGGNTPRDRNVFIGMSQAGIALFGDNNTVKGNYIGIDASQNLNGNRFGIFITGNGNTVGGITDGDRNIISGNDMGISVANFTGNNYIIGNFIGTDADGSHAKANNVGINIIGANTTVGGITPHEANLIAGNHESGILVGVQSTNVAILGNVIGTQGAATGAPNRDGIILGPGSFSSLVEGNHIEGNVDAGILIAGLAGQLESFAHRIGDNRITKNNVGIIIQGNATENTIGSPRFVDFKSNEINFNLSQGVVFSLGADGTLPKNNTVRKNKFKENGNQGILIVTGQEGIEKPIITSFSNDGTNAVVTGTHPKDGSIIDVYSADRDNAGQYEGYIWIGKGVVNTSHTFHFTTAQSSGNIVVATATDKEGNTSEFSDSAQVEGLLPIIQPPSQNVPPPPPPPPFQHGPLIKYRVTDPGLVELRIYDTSGHELEALVHEFSLPGDYEKVWNNHHYPPGIYFYKWSEGPQTRVGKLISVE